MGLSEILTILVAFHQQGYRTFKTYYLKDVCQHWSGEFPDLVSYKRFIDWLPLTLMPLCVYFQQYFGRRSGISFINSTSLRVCHNRHIYRHRVFDQL